MVIGLIKVFGKVWGLGDYGASCAVAGNLVS